MLYLQKLFAFTTISLLFVTVTAFDNEKTKAVATNQLNGSYYCNDTIPNKYNLSNLLQEANTALQEISNALQGVNWKAVEKDINNALASVNIDKVFAEAKKALQEIDVKELSNQLKNKLNAEELGKAKASMQKALEDVRKIDLKLDTKQKEQLKRNLESLKPTIEEKLQQLKKELEQIETISKKTKAYTINTPNEALVLNPIII